MTNTKAPWNKGKKGIEAGWTLARRRKASRNQKRRIQQDPHKFYVMFRSGPQPHTWIVPAHLREHRYRWSRAKAQARFWRQPWTITWPQYVRLFEQCEGEWGRNQRRKGDGELGHDTHMNLARRDTSQGWHLWNVELMPRDQAMRRATGNTRITPKGLGSKKRGREWRRGGKGNDAR